MNTSARKVNRICGSGDINTLFCIGENHDCPINDVYLIDKKTPYSKEYKAVELSPDHLLIYTTNGTFLPTVRFKLTEGKVGFNSKGFETSRHRTLYPLSDYGKGYRSLRYKPQDPRYKQIGKIREDKLFTDNEIYDVVSALPNYPIEDSQEFYWNLYVNSYFYWSKFGDEHEDTTRSNFMSILEGIIDVKKQNDYILETTIFHAFGICLVLQYFFGYFTVSIFRNRNKINSPMRTLFHIFTYPLKVIGLVFLIYFSSHGFRTVTAFQDTVVSVTVSAGSPDFTTQAFFAYEEYLQKVYGVTTRVIIFSSLSLVGVFFDLVCELSIRGILKSTYGKLFSEYVDQD